MTDGKLWLTPSECQWLALSLPSHFTWPPSDQQLPLLGQLPGLDHVIAGGPRLRVMVLALAESGATTPQPLECSLSELWLIDSLLLSQDLRAAKLPDGTLLLTFAKKVWTLLLEWHQEQLPAELRKEETYAQPSDDPDAHADAIASAEAILRSGHGEGAGEDMPPAAA